MSVFFRYLSSVGSIALAISMLTYAVYLIRKNSPKPAQFAVRFSPPVNPDADIPSEPREDKKGRFIGGVGIIEPAGEAITIGSQLPGIVAKVYVVPGANVRSGEPLFELDQRTALANVMVARNNLAAQESKLREMLAQVAPTKARVDAALAIKKQSEATLNNARQELKRADVLASKGALSDEEMGLRRLNVDVAEGKWSEMDAKYREAVANLELVAGEKGAPTIEVQRAVVDQAKAALHKEEVTLQMHTIVAPKDSTALQVKVRVGEFVPASVLVNPLVTLGVTDPYHVRVDIDEADIPRFHEKAKAYASVRGRPEVRVPIEYIRTEPYVIPKKTLNGGVSERVDTRVMQLIYSVSPSAIHALPGQQVDVYVAETDGVF